MKIISWNCNMAFRKKASLLNKFSPDILIVLECEQLDKIKYETWNIRPTDHYWCGNNHHKGVAVFTFNDYQIDTSSIIHNDSFKYIIPLKIYKENQLINLFAVWTQNTYDGHYTRQIYRAIEYYANEIKSHQTIIIGDLNSNSIWDKPKRETNHSNLVNLLETMNVFSVYHYLSKECQGKESVATLYFQRKISKPFHIDYCFTSKEVLTKIKEFSIGQYNDYIAYSDHMPLIVDIFHE